MADFAQIRDVLGQNGALHVDMNRFDLTSKEYTSLKVMGEDVSLDDYKLIDRS